MMSQSSPTAKRYRPSTRFEPRPSDLVQCLICKYQERSSHFLELHYQMKHTKKQMIESIVNISDISTLPEAIENQNIVEDESSNSTSNSSPTPARIVKRRSPASHSYNFRTPSSASMILKQRNSVTVSSSPSVSPCNSSISNSNSPSPYFTPEQTVKRPRRRKQLLNTLLSDVEDESSVSPEVRLIKLPSCNEIKEGIRKIKEEESISKLDSDTDSCSDTAMPSVYCSYCSDGYKSIENLEEHILECLKKDSSVVEDEKCADEIVESIMAPLTEEKVYVCYFCDEEFDLKITLEKHLNDHLGEKIMSDIMQLEDDFGLRSENNFVLQYFAYFTAGYKFGVTDKGACTNAELQFQFYEHLLKDNKYAEGFETKKD